MTQSLATTDLLALLAAIAVAALGGASFLRGVLGVAAWLRLPKLLVATTLAAFATSSPEMAVSSLAALVGKPEIGLGGRAGQQCGQCRPDPGARTAVRGRWLCAAMSSGVTSRWR